MPIMNEGQHSTLHLGLAGIYPLTEDNKKSYTHISSRSDYLSTHRLTFYHHPQFVPAESAHEDRSTRKPILISDLDCFKTGFQQQSQYEISPLLVRNAPLRQTSSDDEESRRDEELDCTESALHSIYVVAGPTYELSGGEIESNFVGTSTPAASTGNKVKVKIRQEHSFTLDSLAERVHEGQMREIITDILSRFYTIELGIRSTRSMIPELQRIMTGEYKQNDELVSLPITAFSEPDHKRYDWSTQNVHSKLDIEFLIDSPNTKVFSFYDKDHSKQALTRVLQDKKFILDAASSLIIEAEVVEDGQSEGGQNTGQLTDRPLSYTESLRSRALDIQVYNQAQELEFERAIMFGTGP
ncbi:hypothetical protein I203_102879 [Kwoniella mangroviensis CBS 8507]|uniref:uncharacterized protein n=1 Tax=Kwoniella mangroviensis CBS 8507 TaxID=1296122 RepID=UPI00080CC25B|nr:uncharacterized protein I203_03853 [Kwoniella mangroviensis CBS 8507]OCF67167.1 hypothetical protein I203_03853 [Kwoniella mangroviensis CBS 8507]